MGCKWTRIGFMDSGSSAVARKLPPSPSYGATSWRGKLDCWAPRIESESYNDDEDDETETGTGDGGGTATGD